MGKGREQSARAFLVLEHNTTPSSASAECVMRLNQLHDLIEQSSCMRRPECHDCSVDTSAMYLVVHSAAEMGKLRAVQATSAVWSG